jgi:hypothetical protein
VKSKLKSQPSKSWWDVFWRDAWTKTLAYVQVAGAGLLGIISYLGNVINNPDVKSALEAMSLPAGIVLGIALFGAVTYMASEHN